jgi:hypothetical protein
LELSVTQRRASHPAQALKPFHGRRFHWEIRAAETGEPVDAPVIVGLIVSEKPAILLALLPPSTDSPHRVDLPIPEMSAMVFFTELHPDYIGSPLHVRLYLQGEEYDYT